MKKTLVAPLVLVVSLALPPVASAATGEAPVKETTTHGTLITSKSTRVAFALPAGTWRAGRNDDGSISPGVYERRSFIDGAPCVINLFVSGRVQYRRPGLTPGDLPLRQARRGTTGSYHWLTGQVGGDPGPAASTPYGAGYRKAPQTAKGAYLAVTAGVGFVEPASAACHRSGARIQLRSLATSFRAIAARP